MDKLIEENFVKRFIIKERRDRVIYELNSSKKRDRIIHQLFNLLDGRYVIFSDSNISDEELLKKTKDAVKSDCKCYVISDSGDDGKSLPFKEAFTNMTNDCCDYFIICGDNVVIAKEEVIFGSPAKKILVREFD